MEVEEVAQKLESYLCDYEPSSKISQRVMVRSFRKTKGRPVTRGESNDRCRPTEPIGDILAPIKNYQLTEIHRI
jgi:hypothetical protein